MHTYWTQSRSSELCCLPPPVLHCSSTHSSPGPPGWWWDWSFLGEIHLLCGKIWDSDFSPTGLSASGGEGAKGIGQWGKNREEGSPSEHRPWHDPFFSPEWPPSCLSQGEDPDSKQLGPSPFHVLVSSPSPWLANLRGGRGQCHTGAPLNMLIVGAEVCAERNWVSAGGIWWSGYGWFRHVSMVGHLLPVRPLFLEKSWSVAAAHVYGVLTMFKGWCSGHYNTLPVWSSQPQNGKQLRPENLLKVTKLMKSSTMVGTKSTFL